MAYRIDTPSLVKLTTCIHLVYAAKKLSRRIVYTSALSEFTVDRGLFYGCSQISRDQLAIGFTNGRVLTFTKASKYKVDFTKFLLF